MAKARKKTSTRQAAVPAHPRIPQPKEIGDLCAGIYRKGVKLAREQGFDEQAVEQLALSDVRLFMTACISQSKADWKAWKKSAGKRAR